MDVLYYALSAAIVQAGLFTFLHQAGAISGVLLTLLLVALLAFVPWLGLVAGALYVLIGLGQLFEAIGRDGAAARAGGKR